MRFHVVHRNQRLVERVGGRLRPCEPDQQRADQSRAGGRADDIHVAQPDTGFLQRGSHHIIDDPQVRA
jgi:hypothetical protein